MNDLLEWLVTVKDVRQQAKVKHLMRDIIALVFFAELANATEWIEIYLFAAAHEEALRKYLKLPKQEIEVKKKSTDAYKGKSKSGFIPVMLSGVTISVKVYQSFRSKVYQVFR